MRYIPALLELRNSPDNANQFQNLQNFGAEWGKRYSELDPEPSGTRTHLGPIGYAVTCDFEKGYQITALLRIAADLEVSPNQQFSWAHLPAFDKFSVSEGIDREVSISPTNLFISAPFFLILLNCCPPELSIDALRDKLPRSRSDVQSGSLRIFFRARFSAKACFSRRFSPGFRK